MTEEQNRKAAQDLIYLVRCAVNQEKPNYRQIDDMEAVYAFACRHKLSAVMAFSLEYAGNKNQLSIQTIATSLRREAIFEKAYGEVKTMLQAANIWYMPLKGIILKQYYPNSCMREMADHDILFDANRAKDVKSIMESLGFTSKHFGASNHDCYYKAPCLNFEMHRALFGTSHDEKMYEYYRNVEERLLGSGCEKHFSPEDFYLYMISHEYKHYSGGGTGLRSLLDVYVYLKSETLDMAYIAAEAEKLGIREFEEEQRSLAFHLFGDGELTKADQEMLDYILSSGTYGTIQHHVTNKLQKKSWSKIQYALDRFFVPVSKKNKDYAAYAAQYPFFYNCKIFLPLLPFYRTFRAMKSGSFNAEARAIKNAKR